MNRHKLSQQMLLPLLLTLLIVGCAPPSATPTLIPPTLTPVPILPTETIAPNLTTSTLEPTSTPLVDPDAELIEVTYDGNECTVSGPAELASGNHPFVFKDLSDENLVLFVSRLSDGKTFQDFLDEQSKPGELGPKPDWAVLQPLLKRTSDESLGGEMYIFHLEKEGTYSIYLLSRKNLWACAPLQITEVDTFDVAINRDIEYAVLENYPTLLDVYTPEQQGTWPVVIIVPGFAQSKTKYGALARAIASQGSVVFVIDMDFRVPWLTSIERVACGVRFARVHATDYGGNPDRITLFGHSGGAATGIVVSLAGDDFERGCVVSDGSALPNAFVGYEGPFNFATTKSGPIDHTYLMQEDPDLLEAIDPYSHIGRNLDLPLRLIHGDDDDVFWYDTPPETSREMYQVLADAGYDVELFIVEGDNHRAPIIGGGRSAAFDLIVEQVLEMMRSSSQ